MPRVGLTRGVRAGVLRCGPKPLIGIAVGTDYPEAVLEQRVVQIGSVPVRYAVTGRGEPLVLIHGLAGSRLWCRRNIPALREHHTVYLIDLPGFGSMRAHRREFSLDEAPLWVRTLLDRLDLRRVSVVGHSMGGVIALALAAPMA